MIIKSIEIYAHALPIVGGPYIMSSGPLEAVDSTIVRMIGETGTVGWGETCPLGPTYAPAHAQGARAALSVLAPALIGQEISGPNALQTIMDQHLAGHAYAKAALDIAFYDLLGQSTGRSVAELLGGALVRAVPSYVALNVADPGETAREAVEKARQGFRRLQLKIGGRDVALDVETARKVAEAVSDDVRLVLDGNRGLSTGDTITLSNALRNIPVVLEQPCEGVEQHRAIRPLLHHPLYLDESASDLAVVAKSLAEGLVDGFGMKLTRMGGLRSMAAFRDLCAAWKLPHSCDDSWGGDIITAACVHMGSTVQPRQLEGVWSAQPYINAHYDPANGPHIRNAEFTVPAGPGLGLKIDPEQFGDPIGAFD